MRLHVKLKEFLSMFFMAILFFPAFNASLFFTGVKTSIFNNKMLHGNIL